MKRAGAGDGEIIQVQGGHIIRATGKKDRHSKVYTAKGPRDRRVRLSAHTAIQFYDVQDRLGYDRPSKAVDWLIKKAKNAIDELSQSPPAQANEATVDLSTDSNPGSGSQAQLEQQQSGSSSKYAFQLQRHLGGDLRGNSLVMPPPAETQSFADSMRSFFPMSSDNSLLHLQSYSHNRLSRTGIQTGDLGLSLQTLQDQNLNHRTYTDEVLLSGANPVQFEANYTKTEAWSAAGEAENRHVGFIFNSHSMPQQLLYSQNSAFSQREPLQPNYSHLIPSWNERQFPSVDHQNAQAFHQSSLYGIHFGPNFQIPSRIHGEDEPGMLSVQPSSTSPSSQQL